MIWKEKFCGVISCSRCACVCLRGLSWNSKPNIFRFAEDAVTQWRRWSASVSSRWFRTAALLLVARARIVELCASCTLAPSGIHFSAFRFDVMRCYHADGLLYKCISSSLNFGCNLSAHDAYAHRVQEFALFFLLHNGPMLVLSILMLNYILSMKVKGDTVFVSSDMLLFLGCCMQIIICDGVDVRWDLHCESGAFAFAAG